MANYLVCEGENGGLDDRVLNALVLQQLPNVNFTTEPAGGGHHVAAACSYIRNRKSSAGQPPDVAVSIQDRDYKTAFATAEAGWVNPKAASYHWRRHEVENYLLCPTALLDLFDYYRTVGPPWAAGLPATVQGVTALLEHVADSLLDTHAAQVLKVELFGMARNANLRFDPAAPKGTPTPEDWRAVFHQEATRLRASCDTVRHLPEFEAKNIDTCLSALTAEFRQPAFLQSGDYLRELAGKEMVQSVAVHLRGLGALQNLSKENFESDWLDALVRTYKSGVTFQPDCFQQLAARLAQYP